MDDVPENGDGATLASILAESRVQTAALQEIVRSQGDHSQALTKLLERGGAARSASGMSHGSGVVTWSTLAAILGGMFALIGIVFLVHGAQISAGIEAIGSVDTHVRRWSSDHDRTFGPIVTDLAGRVDANCERIQLHLAKDGAKVNCDRSPRPWPEGSRGGR